jgi:hypothetical protein
LPQLFRRAVYVAFAASIVLYSLQVFTPLRLMSDVTNYLSLADSAATRGLVSAFSQPNFPFPKGYPAFVFLLMKAGVFSSAVLVFANLLFFGLALIFSFRTLVALGFGRRLAGVACLLTLLSFAAVKHITMGMSDFLFFALAAAACWFMTWQSPYKWLALFPCMAFAIEVRLIGLALLFPLAATIWPFVKKYPLALAISGAVALAFVVMGAWAGRQYLVKYLHVFERNGLGGFVKRDVVTHCQDFAELMVNVPLSRLPAWCHALVLTLGGCALLLFFAGIVALWKRSLWTSFYMIGFSALILPWPYTDPRFWVPAMPFVLLTIHAGGAALLKGVAPKTRTTNVAGWLVAAYCVIFCALGFAALAYSTRLTFAGPRFPYLYGDKLLRSTYLAGCSGAPADADPRALHLLRRYEWHCENER